MPLKDIYYSISEAAQALDVSRQTIYRWISDKKIQSEKIGGVVLIEKRAVTEYGAARVIESIYRSMDNYCIKYIKQEYGYGDEDQIEKTEVEDDYLVYLVTQTNGKREKIMIGGMDITLSIGREQESAQVTNIIFKDIIKTEARQSKSKNKKGGR